MDELSILTRAELGRCPRCNQLIDLSVSECPHCRAFLTVEERRTAARLEKEGQRRMLRIYDRKNLIYGLASLAGVVILALFQLAYHLHLWNAKQRTNVLDIVGHLGDAIRSNLLPFVALFVLLPVLMVVLMRRRRRD